MMIDRQNTDEMKQYFIYNQIRKLNLFVIFS